jgi:hypothetical protein
MRYVFWLAVCCLFLLSCKSDSVVTNDAQSISGRTTIDSRSEYGFSFARGTPQSFPYVPLQDSVDDFFSAIETDSSGPTPIGICFGANGTLHMFHLVGWPSTSDSARSFFQALSGITDTSFLETTCGYGIGGTGAITRSNQIWSVQTHQNKFAKMLIVSDTTVSNYLQVTFDWVYQPSGSRRF